MLTKKQKKDYFKYPFTCPYCGSGDIKGSHAEMGMDAYQLVKCSDCKKQWKDCYTLTDIEEIA
jgi:transcription elongation factor Elf1